MVLHKKAGIWGFIALLFVTTACTNEGKIIPDEKVVLAPTWKEESPTCEVAIEEQYNVASEISKFGIIDDLGKHRLNKFGTNGDYIFTSILNAKSENDYDYGAYTNQIYNLDGTVVNTVTRDYQNHLQPTFVQIDEMGNWYSVMVEYVYNEKTCESTTKKNQITATTATGEELWTIEMGFDQPDGMDYRIRDMILTQEGDLVVASSKGVEMVHRDGSYVGCIPVGTQEVVRLIRIKNGDLLALCPISDNKFQEEMDVFVIDPKTGSIKTDPINFPFPITRTNCNSGVQSDLLLTYGGFLYSYDLAEQKLDKLIDFAASGLPALNANEIVALKNGSYLITSYNWNSSTMYGKILQKNF